MAGVAPAQGERVIGTPERAISGTGSRPVEEMAHLVVARLAVRFQTAV